MTRRRTAVLTNSALSEMQEIARHADEVPSYLSAIHHDITHPLEGGLNTWDAAGVTYRGITAATFDSVMDERGIDLSPQQSRDALLAIARGTGQNGPAGRAIFADFGSYVHYTRYFQRPGFDALPVPFQTALYDTSFNRGNGATLIMLLRMAQRNGHGTYEGIHSLSEPLPFDAAHPATRDYHPTIPRPRQTSREALHPADPNRPGYHLPNLDVDPVVLERILDEHRGRVRDRMRESGRAGAQNIIPAQLYQDLLDYGFDPERDHIQLVDTRFEEPRPIDWTSTSEIPEVVANSAQIRTPFDDRWSLLPSDNPNRAQWDNYMRQAVEAAERMNATMSPAQIVEAFERERETHFNQIIQVEPSNADNYGWFTRIAENRSYVQAQAAQGPQVVQVTSRVNLLPLSDDSLSRAVATATGIDPAQDDIAAHLRIIRDVLNAQNVRIDTGTNGTANGSEIFLTDILPDIDTGNPDLLSDNRVRDRNVQGEVMPTLSGTAETLRAALQRYYEENATTSLLENADIDALDHIRIRFEQVNGVETATILGVDGPDLGYRQRQRDWIESASR